MTHAGRNPADKTLPALGKHPRASCDGNRLHQAALARGQGDNGDRALINVHVCAWVCMGVCARTHVHGLGVCSQEELAGTSGRRASWGGRPSGDRWTCGCSVVLIPRKTAEAWVPEPAAPPPGAGPPPSQLDPATQGRDGWRSFEKLGGGGQRPFILQRQGGQIQAEPSAARHGPGCDRG